LLGLEKVLNVGALQLVGEYQSIWLERDPGFGATDLHFDGVYFYASYFLTGEHMPWDRASGTLARIKPFQNFWLVHRCDGEAEAGWGAWQIAARYSYADLTDENVFGGRGSSFTYGLNWYWNQNSRMQFNYLYGQIEDRFATLDKGNYSIFGARFMVDF
jgi:phosphate-selective porin OprO/OprP